MWGEPQSSSSSPISEPAWEDILAGEGGFQSRAQFESWGHHFFANWTCTSTDNGGAGESSQSPLTTVDLSSHPGALGPPDDPSNLFNTSKCHGVWVCFLRAPLLGILEAYSMRTGSADGCWHPDTPGPSYIFT